MTTLHIPLQQNNFAETGNIKAMLLGRKKALQLLMRAVFITFWMMLSSAALAFDADLQIANVNVDDTTPDEGQTIVITVQDAENKGPADPAPAVIVDIPLPAGLTYVSDDSGGAYDPITGVWTIGDFADGPKLSLNITATVDFGTGGTTLTPTATISSTDPAYNDTNTGNNTRFRDIIVNAADLEVIKTVDDLVPDEGQTVTFDIVVANNGEATADNIVISDVLPITLTYVSHTVNQGAYDEVTGEWTVGTLTKGNDATLTIDATVNAGTSGTSITNTARVLSVDQSDDDLSNNQSSAEMTVATPDLLVTKAVNDTSPDELQNIEYEIIVENLGPAQATGVEITDLLPAGLTYSSTVSIDQGSYDPVTGIWDVGIINAGAKPGLIIEATVDTGTAAQTIRNTAAVTGLVQTDGDISNNSAFVDIFVNGADLEVTKTVDNVTPSELDTVTYTVRIDNNGPLEADAITIDDLLPAGVTFVSAVESQGSYDEVAGVWTVGKVKIAEFATLDITVTVDAGTKGSAIINTASVSASNQPDSLTDNNTDDALIIIGDADPAVTKSVNVSTADEGDTVTYTVTVTNNGPDPAAAFVIDDPLPAGLTYVSHSITADPGSGTGVYDPLTGTWDFGSDLLENGDSAVLTVNATVNTGTAAQTIINIATLTAVESGNDPSNDVASASFQVNGADIEVVKTVDNDRPAANVPYTYTITVTNNGPDDATGVEVTDFLPFGVVYVSDSPSQGSYSRVTGIWTVGSLANGASATLDFVATTTISTVNTATKTASDQPDSATANDTSSVSVAPSITFGAGSCIIDMGVGVEQPDPLNPTIFQGYDKGLEPYSLIYELITTYEIPIYWSINPDKSGFMPPPEALADYSGSAPAIDFTADGKNYYGGPFIIDVEFITPAVQNVLDTWDPDGNGTGPTVDCPTSDFTAPIFNTVTSFPRAVLDEANGDKIQTAFYDESEVPASSYRIGTPEDLTECDDLYAMPHADPQGWPDSYLTTFEAFINQGGSLWAACHAVSALEALADVPTADGTNDFNLLSNRGLIPWGNHDSGTPIAGDPTDYRYDTSLGADPIMQFVSSFDGSIQNGSEQIYLPFLDPINTNTGEIPTITDDPLAREGGWRTSTNIGVWDPGHPDVEDPDPENIISPGKAALLAFGRSYGDPNLGTIVYEASHTIAGGSEFENTSAARAYGNLLLKVGIDRRPQIEAFIDTTDLELGESTGITTIITGGDPGYMYEWSDTCGGTFTPSITDPNPTYTAPDNLTESTSCVLRAIISDACNRANFEARILFISLPTLSGTVFEDTDGPASINGFGTDGDGLFVSLVDSSGNVVQSIAVNADGTYTFTELQAYDYTVQLNSTAQSIGVPPAAPDLQPDWFTVGENLGAGVGNDGSADGILAVTVGTEDVSDANFGIVPFNPGSIAGVVWLDEDQDGINDIEEAGLTNVIVELNDGACDPLPLPADCPQAITDQHGNYLFDYLEPGQNYSVTVITSTLPPDLTITEGPFGEPTRIVFLGNGEAITDEDFGYKSIAGFGIIGDRVWSDTNANGIQDPGEAGIAGVELTLTDSSGTPLGSVFTNSNGDYLFTNVPFGDDYIVSISATDAALLVDGFLPEDGDPLVPGGATEGPQSIGGLVSNPITLSPALTTVTDVDFGFDNPVAEQLSITDRVWYDINGDGIEDPGEPGITGVGVDLLDASGNVVATTVTDANGDFSFVGIPEGSGYTLMINDLANALDGMTETTATGGNESIPGSLFDATGGAAGDGLLDTVDDDGTATFGFNNPGSIAGTVFGDANDSDTQNNGETGLGGIEVTLTPLDPLVDLGNGPGVAITTLTNPDGSYLFDGLPPGDYDIELLSPPAGVNTIDPDSGAGAGVPGDDGATISLGVGEGLIGLDFGYQNTALFDISGTVFQDTDKDGVEEVGEPGIPGVTIDLLDASGNVIATTVSDTSGNYNFPDLADGDYTVAVTDTTGQLAGYDITSGLDALPVMLAGADELDVDFGYVKDEATGSISGEVFLDENLNGTAEGEEFDLSGVTVYLCLAIDAPCNASNAVATTTTDANGEYVFSGLPAGVYELGTDPATVPGGLDLSVDPAPVSLSEGENVSDVDIGYDPAANTGTLSGVVWTDANSDGNFDPGEAPIPGVTINVHDDQGNILYSTVTALDGSWLISGIPITAGVGPNDLAVLYDPATIPSDLNNIQPSNLPVGDDLYYNQDLEADPDNNIGSLDFGFQPNAINSLGSISGTVYSDANQDGDYVPAADGEFQGVTLNLLDDTGNIIASTITDANGNYSFTGLPPGSYEVVVTDIDNVLQDLNPNELLPASVVVAAGDDVTGIDAGYQSGVPNADREPVGNKFWFDTNGDGIVDDTEPGIEGITIQVWLDNNASATPDTPGGGICPDPMEKGTPSEAPEPGIDNLVRTTTTDQNGEYYFTNLPAGQYIVVVSDSLGFTEAADGTCVPNSAADNNAKPWTYALTHTGTISNLAADFGVTGANSLSGHVFIETEGTGPDGVFDGTNDSPAKGVAVILLIEQDGTFVELQSTTTDASGSYAFAGLPDGNYRIEVVTDNSVVDGFDQTADPDVTLDDEHSIELNGGASPADLDFGYQKNYTTTPVTVNYFHAQSVGGGIEFSWETSNEVGHVGYQIYARAKEGWQLLNEELIEGVAGGAMDRRQYRYTVYGVDSRWFSLVDVSAAEEVTPHGPYRVGQVYGAELERAEAFDWNGIKPPSPSKSQVEDSVNYRLQHLLEADERAARDNPGAE